MSVVDRRVLEEIERTVLTRDARRLVLETAEESIRVAIEQSTGAAPDLAKARSRLDREIENLLRAIETGAAPAVLLDRLREKERERAALDVQLAAAADIRHLTQLDARRVRRVLEDGLSRLGAVLRSDTAATRRALEQIFAEKVRFKPIELPTGERTYQFEAKLSLGRIVASTRQNGEDVPDGICTLLFTRFPLLTIVKRTA